MITIITISIIAVLSIIDIISCLVLVLCDLAVPLQRLLVAGLPPQRRLGVPVGLNDII